MAATQILAIGSAAADSGDIVIAAATTVALKDADGGYISSGSIVRIALKDDGGFYTNVAELNSLKPSYVITGPGTYRFSRLAGGGSVGVFSG